MVTTGEVEVDDAVVGQLTVLFAILLSRSQYTSTHPDSTTTIPMTSPVVFQMVFSCCHNTSKKMKFTK